MDNLDQMQILAEVLGIEKPRDQLALIEIARTGLPGHSLDLLAKSLGLSMFELSKLFNVSSRTLLRHRKQLLGIRLTGRALTIGKVIALATEVFQDSDKARMWLKSRCDELNSRPIDLLETTVGSGLVMETLASVKVNSSVS